MVEQAPQTDRDAILDQFAARLDQEINIAKTLAARRLQGEQIPDFDIRGKLYELALELAPEARVGDILAMQKLIKPKKGEISVDIAAGTGFLTKPLIEWTGANVYAIDPSKEQLQMLDQHCGQQATSILGSPDDPSILSSLPLSNVDIVTSFGGIHHVSNQERMMTNIETMLKKGGRFVAADVCADTALARHFDDYVSKKCMTGHMAQWLSEDRLKQLTKGTSLFLTHVESRPLVWKFHSEREMALFFKGLHAYDVPEGEIIHDVKEALGTFLEDGMIHLNWPMLFFEIVKQ